MQENAKFKGLGIIPSTLNVSVRKLSDCPQKYSDNRNGYFIVADTWGTCFFRISNTRDHIEIQRHKNPSNDRTYTKIPIALIDNVFFVYVNWQIATGKSFLINMPPGARVIGMHDHTLSGDYTNASYLIYSPTEEAPSVEETEDAVYLHGCLCLQKKDMSKNIFTIDDMMRDREIRHIYTNEEGFVITKHNHKTFENVMSRVGRDRRGPSFSANRR